MKADEERIKPVEKNIESILIEKVELKKQIEKELSAVVSCG